VRLLIKFPTRGRPARFFEALERYRELLSGKHEVRFVISLDEDDAAMNVPSIIDALKRGYGATVRVGPPEGKIAACNRDVPDPGEAEGETARWPWDVLLLASDDMIPEVHGYDDVIARAFEACTEEGPILACTNDVSGPGEADNSWGLAPLDRVVHFNDGYVGDRLCTLSIMGRSYYQRFGYIYHPSYRSLWCDNEFTDVAKSLDRYTYVDRVIIRHEHPAWVAGCDDDLYRVNNAHDREDRKNYESRKRVGFPSASGVCESV
jgi:hypothetical protein